MTERATWSKAALHFSLVEASKSTQRIFTRAGLMANHMASMVALTGSQGKTPAQTLSRTLQDLRDGGLIRFCRAGTYQVIQTAEAADAELAKLDATRASRGERMVGRVLDSMGITYAREKTFRDLRLRGLLRFDFYFEVGPRKFAIEYDGRQHQFAVEFFGGIPKMIERNICDRLKTRYAAEHGIELLRVRDGASSEDAQRLVEGLLEWRPDAVPMAAPDNTTNTN